MKSFSDQQFHEPGLDFNIVYYGTLINQYRKNYPLSIASLYVAIFRNITTMLNNILLYCACIMYAMSLTPVEHNHRRYKNVHGQKNTQILT